MEDKEIILLLRRAVETLERISPPPPEQTNFEASNAFVWHANTQLLETVKTINSVDFHLLKGIKQQQKVLLENTTRFAKGLPANNVLLWGARGTGKSSLVKATHAEVNNSIKHPLILVEIHRDDLLSLPELLKAVRRTKRRVLIFCDDLSFDNQDNSYKSLKTILEGGIEEKPSNVIFYATSNRRHLMPREMIENEQSSSIYPSEAIEEKVSLSDRFGLWLGFHNIDQKTYLDIVDSYADYFNLGAGEVDIHAEANEWAITRGSRSGRVAWQFTQDLAGRLGKKLKKP